MNQTPQRQPEPSGGAASVRRQPRRFDPAAILGDLEAGHEPLTLRRATKEPWLCARGRASNVAVLYRAAQPTNPNPLETAVVNGVLVVTRPPLLRWLARNNKVGRPEVPVPAHGARRRERTESKLDTLGIK